MSMKVNKRDLETFNKLIDHIYNSALDNKLWLQFMQNCAETFDAHGMLMRIQDIQTKEVFEYYTHGLDPDFQQQYADRFVRHDPLIATVSRLETGTIAQAAQLPQDEYRNTEYFNDYIIPQGNEQIAGGIISRNNSRIAILAIHRTDEKGAYTQEELRMLRLLFPHVKRAIDINRHVQQITNESHAVSDILDRMHAAVILVDSSGRPQLLNKKAEMLVTGNCGIEIGRRGIRLSRHEDTQTLQRLIYNASRNNPKIGGTLITSNTALQELNILVEPINEDSHFFNYAVDLSGIAAAIFIDTKEYLPLNISIEVVSRLYGLTYAEARLSTALANGYSLDEIASKYNVSKSTLRSQLKASFLKTGVRRQADLVKLILSGPSVLVDGSWIDK